MYMPFHLLGMELGLTLGVRGVAQGKGHHRALGIVLL